MMKQKRVQHFLRYILASLLFILSAAAIQMTFVYKTFDIKFILIPSIVGIVFGTLLAIVSDLRKQLRYQSKLFSSLVDFSPDVSYIKNLDGTIEYISPSIEKLTGYKAQDFYDNPKLLDTMVDPRDQERWTLCQKRRKSVDEEPLEVRFIHKNGDIFWIEHNHDTVLDENSNIIGIRATNHDITRRKNFEDRIQDLANYDSLTQLPNRRLLMLKIDQSLQDAQVYGSEFSIMFVDLDRFKYVNDTFGHSFGDQLLIQVAQRLTSVAQQRSLIFRFGGDEFVVLFPKNSQKELLETFANELLAVLNRVYIINDVTIYIDAKIGISRFPYDGNTPDILIKNADIAMYKAKNSKHLPFCFYSVEFSKQSSDFFAIERALHDAIKKEEIYLYYQPQFDIQSLEVVGAEALARWIKKDGTMISPDEFIPVAEESGMIIQLGDHVIDLSLKMHALLKEQSKDIRIAVNVSPFQLQVREQYLAIIKKFKDSAIDTKNLEVEVTESLFFEQSNEQIENLKLFSDEGYSIAIDDFGTGFSSLSYLKNMPADYLKIDKIFTSNMQKSPADRAIVESIIAMAHSFNMKVIAEGIETKEELQLLKDLGCDYGQGFYYAKPMPKGEFLAFLDK